MLVAGCPRRQLVKRGPEDIFSRRANDRRHWGTKSTCTVHSHVLCRHAAIWVAASYCFGFSRHCLMRLSTRVQILSCQLHILGSVLYSEHFSMLIWNKMSTRVQIQIVGLLFERDLANEQGILFSSMAIEVCIHVSSMYHQMTTPRASRRPGWK